MKFFLYTMAGSLLMLVAILCIGWRITPRRGGWSFALDDL